MIDITAFDIFILVISLAFGYLLIYHGDKILDKE